MNPFLNYRNVCLDFVIPKMNYDIEYRHLEIRISSLLLIALFQTLDVVNWILDLVAGGMCLRLFFHILAFWTYQSKDAL